jgi:hypothetical protein
LHRHAPSKLIHFTYCHAPPFKRIKPLTHTPCSRYEDTDVGESEEEEGSEEEEELEEEEGEGEEEEEEEPAKDKGISICISSLPMSILIYFLASNIPHPQLLPPSEERRPPKPRPKRMATASPPRTRMKKKTETASQKMKSQRTPPKPAVLLPRRLRLRGALFPRRPRLTSGRRTRSSFILLLSL